MDQYSNGGGVMAGASGSNQVQLRRSDLSVPKNTTEREVGSVERELSRMSEAVMALEHTLAAHAGKIEPVVLMTPATAGGQANAPDAAVCGVADRIRTMRRRLEDLTGQLSYLTNRIDL